ncbi:beta-ketoacyl-ACP synthase III [Brevibacillus sp. HB2.2]|uniref:beta-ketoacyl-ACP synthase III n=1 Tax=Brevibacillus sp. HB2.2 TaxID=2738846 RepID=UPI00156B8613|nr:beta-ketoacyl-ACP synthase III [Brevibacillus sp. HB2.2]NRS48686.1 beta-ketoacyl-ACP synthase III [Brevibacillus sp. HB2.2]
MERKIKILGTGKYLPTRRVTAAELEEKLGLAAGWVEKKSGVSVRHFVTNETAAQMGAIAAKRALEAAGLSLHDIDCIVCASGTAQQEIPCTAALIQEELQLSKSGIPCFDINATCLSFVTALDVMSCQMAVGIYERVLIISSEISSAGLNWEQKESCVLFGDGAAAVVIGRTPETESSRILGSSMKTYSEGAHYSEIRGGGTLIHPRQFAQGREADFAFDMDGRKIFRLTSQLITGFVDRLLSSASVTMEQIRTVIPHQASGMAMRIMAGKLGFSDQQMVNILADHGNVIAASIPMALHEAIGQNRVQRGDHLMLLGTSAGLSLGGIVLEY